MEEENANINRLIEGATSKLYSKITISNGKHVYYCVVSSLYFSTGLTDSVIQIHNNVMFGILIIFLRSSTVCLMRLRLILAYIPVAKPCCLNVRLYKVCD